MKITISIAALFLAGCAVSSPVEPYGKDTYLVSSHVGSCMSCSASIQGMKTANAYCAKEGKFAIMRHTSGATNGFGFNVSNELVFSCVTADDPEY